MVKIDSTCVYVPAQYISKEIAIAESGTDYNNGRWLGTVVNCPSGGGWVNHKDRADSGISYDVFVWESKECIGTAQR